MTNITHAKIRATFDGETIGLAMYPLNNDPIRDATLEPVIVDGALILTIDAEADIQKRGDVRVAIGGLEKLRELEVAVADARAAARLDSNDAEIAALQHALAVALEALGVPEPEDDEDDGPECEVCGETIADDDMHAEHGMCGSCSHNARRSGWEPGQ